MKGKINMSCHGPGNKSSRDSSSWAKYQPKLPDYCISYYSSLPQLYQKIRGQESSNICCCTFSWSLLLLLPCHWTSHHMLHESILLYHFIPFKVLTVFFVITLFPLPDFFSSKNVTDISLSVYFPSIYETTTTQFPFP